MHFQESADWASLSWMDAAVLQLPFTPRGLCVRLYEEFLSVADRDHVTLHPMYVVECVAGGGGKHEQHMAGLRMMMKEGIT